MNKGHSYTWRNDWIRWFESPWSIVEKFKYANDISSRYLLQILGTKRVQRIRGEVGELNTNFIAMRGFDPKLTKEIFIDDLLLQNRYYLDLLFKYFPFRTNENFFMRSTLSFCKECLKKGYHSHLHQVTFLQNCPFHLESLHHKCPKCNQEFKYGCTDKGFSEAFTCNCGYRLFQVERSETFYSTWSVNQILKDDKVKKWVDLKNEQREVFQTLQMYPSQELQYSPQTLDGLLEAALPHLLKTSSYITIKSTPRIREIKGQREIQENGQFENIKEKHIRHAFRVQKLHEDLYPSYCRIISSIARHLRHTILHSHKNCIKRYYVDKDNAPKCPFAFAYIHWRTQVERYRNSQDITSISSPMIVTPEEVKFPFQAHNDFFEKLFSQWSKASHDITEESRSSLKWIFGRSVAHVSLLLFYQYLRYASINKEFDQSAYIVPFQTENIRPFFFTIDFLKKEPFHMYLETEQVRSAFLATLNCPHTKIKRERLNHRKMFLTEQE